MNASEKQIQDSILQWLTVVKIFHYRQNTGAFRKDYTRKRDGVTKTSFIKFGTPGASDIVCVVKGFYIAIEVKDHKGKQDPDQLEFQKALEKSGGYYILARSLEDVMNFFKVFYQATK